MAKCILGAAARRDDAHKKARERTRKRISEFVTGRMRSEKISQEELGNLLGISQSAASNRVRKGMFEADELPLVLELLNADDEEILRLIGTGKRKKEGRDAVCTPKT